MRAMDSAGYEIGQTVYAYHGPLLFKAEVLEMQEKMASGTSGAPPIKVRLCRVHYEGWDDHWDEWVPVSRLIKDLKKGEELQKQRIREFKRAHNKRKAQQEGSTAESGSSVGGVAETACGATPESSNKKAKGGVEPGDAAIAAEIREQLRLPQNLKLKLVEDWERISREKKLVPLPRNPSIETVLLDFVAAKAKRSSHERLYTEVCDGLRSYFNQALGQILLYKYERRQFQTIRQDPKHKDKPLVELYGAEHLLRLAMKLPDLLAHAKLQREHMTVLLAKLMELLKFLQSNKAKYFVQEYDTPDAEYLAWWGNE